MHATYFVKIDSNEKFLSPDNLKEIFGFVNMRLHKSKSVLSSVCCAFTCEENIPKGYNINDAVKVHGIISFVKKFCKRTQSKFSIRIFIAESETVLFYDS